MLQRISAGLVSAVLLVGVLLPGCGSDDESNGSKPGGAANSCYVQCSDGLTSCTSSPGLSESQCQASGASDCGGTPTAVVLQTGCDCPGFDEPGECKNPPSWYQ